MIFGSGSPGGRKRGCPAADAIALSPAMPALRGTVLSLTLTPFADRAKLAFPVTQRVPFRIEEEQGRLTIRLYNTVSDINWTRYGAAGGYVRDIHWLQAASDEVTITLDLAGPVWGYRTRWSGNDLIFEVRPPPRIDGVHPLRDRLIVVDPGHPPFGATGPTGLREAEANLGVALLLAGPADGSRGSRGHDPHHRRAGRSRGAHRSSPTRSVPSC